MDPDEQSERQRLCLICLNPLLHYRVRPSGDERRRSIGTNDAPSDRFLGAAQGARERHRRPGPPSTCEKCSGLEVPNNGERCRGPDLPILWKRDPGSEVLNISERCHGPDLPANNERFPGVEVLGGSPRVAASGRGGPQVIHEARPGKKQRSQVDVVTELYCFV